MIQRSILIAGLLSTAVYATSIAAPPADAPKALVAKPVAAAPASRVEARGALEDSVAAALVGAISEQFRERDVEVRIDGMQIEPVSVVGRDVRGQGRVQFGDSAEIPFQFQALYDTATTQVARPALILGAQGRAVDLALSSGAARALLAEVRSQISGEFVQQAPRVNFDRVVAADAGARYQRIEAVGRTDFRGEGAVKTTATALYDRSTGKLLHVDYMLGTESNWHSGTSGAKAPLASL